VFSDEGQSNGSGAYFGRVTLIDGSHSLASETCTRSILMPPWRMVLPSQQLPADETARCGDDQDCDWIPSDYEERAVIGAVCRIEGCGDAACRQAGDGTRQEAYPVDSGFPRCSVLSDRIGAVARADIDGEGAV
jgi:hypothetical protein